MTPIPSVILTRYCRHCEPGLRDQITPNLE